MDGQFVVLLLATFVIYLIGTLAYSVRITGVMTGRIAVSMALFNVLFLVSRAATTIQGPLLGRRIDGDTIQAASIAALETDFRRLLLVASVATVAGAFLIPTFHRLLSKAVVSFSVHRSIPRVILHSFSRAGILHLSEAIHLPEPAALARLPLEERLPWRVVLLNIVATGITTVGPLAAFYAGRLVPDYRATATTLSGVVNGAAAILLLLVIEPYLSMLTDDALQGKVAVSFMRRAVVWLVGSQLVGTLFAQLLLLPAAGVIAAAATWLQAS
jgi:hypothetical protein